MTTVATHKLQNLNASSSIKSRLGYDIEFFDEDNELIQSITITDDLGRAVPVDVIKYKFGNDDIDDAFTDWLINRIQHYMPASIEGDLPVIRRINSIYQSTDESEYDDRCDFIEYVFNKTLSNSKKSNKKIAKAALVSLYKYCLLNEAEGFSFEYYYDLVDKPVTNRNRYARVLQLDPELGPFTDSELALLTPLQSDIEIEIDLRTVLGLAQTFGLRPKQIVLLREADFFHNETTDEYYLNVPRMKQDQQLNRSEFTKRLIVSEVLIQNIQNLIEINGRLFPNADDLPRPLFFRKVYSEKHKRLRTNSDYYYHNSTKAITALLNSLGSKTPISARTGKPLHIRIYRFRYTIGTNAVMDGKSETEVASLLDHSSLGSVKHYFKMTSELGELLDELTEDSQEQRSFVAAWHRIEELDKNIYTDDIIEMRTLACLGKCSKSTSCDFEPAIACYGCDSFFAGRNLDAHKSAKINIEERIIELQKTSTGHVPNQLVQAKIGVLAAIKYAEGGDE